MACPNNFVIFIWIIVFSLVLSDTVHDKNEERLNDANNEEVPLEYRRRKAKDHLSTLSSNPNTWVDPYLMIPAKECQEKFVEATDDINLNYPILEDDDQPLFSDVNGNVIIEKVLATPHRHVIDDLDAGGIFQKDQQQVCVLDSIYIARWLKKLIFKIEDESNLEASAVSFQLDSVLLNNLKEISLAKSLKITELDILICNMLSQMVVSRIETFDRKFLQDSYSDALWVIVYVMSIGFIMYGLICFFKQHPKLMFFICVLVVFVLWHWMCLYQHIKAYNHAELSSIHIPKECKRYNFRLHLQEYISSFFINNECNKFFESFIPDPMLDLNATLLEAIKAILPFSSLLQINCDITPLHDNWLFYILLFLVMFILLLIMVYPYGINQLNKGAFLLLFKTNSSIPSTCIKTEDYSSSNTLRGQNFNSDRFSYIDSIQSNVPENIREFFSDQCDDQSCSEDDNSYSENSSWSDNSFDSQDCPCCVSNSELIQELHVGCRVCDNNNATTESAGTFRDGSESLFKNESADFTDASEQWRNHGMHKRETAYADSSQNLQSIIDPSAG